MNNVIRGNSAANVLTGLAGDDTIYGNSGNDSLFGGTGNDYLNGGYGADAMSGGTGNDTYIVDHSSDVVTELADEGIDIVHSSVSHTLSDNVENLTLTGYGYINGTGNTLDNVIIGNTRNNTLSGLAGNDTLIGNSGHDTLDGGTGADTMSGGYGNDTYVVDDSGDVVSESYNRGTDHVRSSIDYTLTDNVENLTLTSTADIDGTGNNLNNVITGNSGSNILDGRGGHDTIYGNAGDDTLIGGDGNDRLYAGDGADQLFGNAGSDTLDGGSGVDTMVGGTGDDTYIVDATSDVVVENVGEGVDLVQSSATYTLSDNVENLTLTGSASINGTGNELNNVIRGNSAANVLTGLAGDDTIYGNSGNDSLLGGDGLDYLDGGTGADAMSGGTDDDTYIVDNADDTVTELVGEGTDTVRSSVSYTLSDNVENLTLTGSASISGTGNELDNVLTGNSGSNILSGLAGNDTLLGNSGPDTLDGGSGADIMSGGYGSDTYVVDDAGDVVNESYNAGTDHVHAGIDYTLGENVENLTLTGTADLNGIGNNLNNVITGNVGNNVLDGGSGADTLIGGAGDDTYMIDNSADAIVELFDGGIDTVHSSASFTISDNIENLYLTGTASINGTGNDVDNLIVGNNGNNTLSGKGGSDTIYGGNGNDVLNGGDGVDRLFGESGNDTINGGTGADMMTGGIGDDIYVVDDAGDMVIENAGEGIDTVWAGLDYTLGDHVENLVLTGNTAINGTGDEFGNVISGNDGSNVLNGLAGDDTLIGNGGDDTLIGGLDADIMQGGIGNDTYVVDDAGDTVVEAANAGRDTVQASIDYTLTDNVENLTLTGTANLKGTGNALSNTITGNEDANIIDGGMGADTMVGGSGDDTYLVDNTADAVIEAADAGTDTVLASIDHTLAANVENLVLTGTGELAGTGNAMDNALTGNSGSNILAGEDGNDLLDGGLDGDTLVGGSGDDTYVVDNAGDTVVESSGQGIDTVLANVSHTLNANVENLELTGEDDINGTGNDSDNVIIGNSGGNILAGGGGNDYLDGSHGADTLAGGGGNDFLEGGLGDDILQGGAGDDRYVFQLGDGNDRIVDDLGQNTLYVGSGLTEFDLKADRVGNDMFVQVLGTTDTFVLADGFLQTGEGLNTMEFDDGTVLDRTGIEMLMNRPPVANLDQITAYEDGGPLVFSTSHLLANDTDPNPWDVLTVTSVGASETGVSVSLENGEITYDIGDGFQSLAEGEVAHDRFAYTISDIKGATANGIVEVDIVGVNDIPVVQDAEPIFLKGVLTANGTVDASDVDGDTLSYSVSGAPEHGILSIDEQGSWLYTAKDGYYGADRATITVDDGNGGMVTTSLDFTVNVYEEGDWIINGDGPDGIQLKGVSKDDLQLSRIDNDLFVAIRERGSITMRGYFAAPENGVKLMDTLEGPLHLTKDQICEMETGSRWRRRPVEFGEWGAKNLIHGTDSSDRIFGADQNDVLFGGDGHDTMKGHCGDDSLFGGFGHDLLYGQWGTDTLYGDSGDDILLGGSGNDVLVGGDGNDRLKGGSGDDWLWGNQGRDRLYGGKGNDKLTGSQGNDLLKGGAGDDIYYFERGDGLDIIREDHGGYGKHCHKHGDNDTVKFGEGIVRDDISVFMKGSTLFLQYGNDDIVTVRNPKNKKKRIERFELSDGAYLTDTDINQIIQEISAFAVNEGIDMNSANDVRQSEQLMNIVVNSWNYA
ncbi:Ig-like domain-containing protein [Desulfovulcanus ferrireducens]|uniref:Ig-like domain-containing protein n=1 Tax=Desulfovulcanus ferrireducens TaxID=2831190 RepID=UPI00207BA885|nr:Ig-like domain-containing protein [Desulfovulcanus ferrireducens]